MNKPRFRHDLVAWPRDTYLGAFERFDIYFEDREVILLILRFGDGEEDYHTGNSTAIRKNKWDHNNVVNVAREAALKMYDDYAYDPSVSPNARV